MKRIFFFLIIIAAASSAGATLTLAQSRRARHVEPPKEVRAEAEAEQQDAAKDESKDKAKDQSQGESQTADGEVLTGKEVTARAVIKSKPLPGYPRGARPYGVEGRVKLRLILGADGKVGDKIDVLEGLPDGLTEEAIKAARKIKFEPAQKDGRPVSQYVTIIYNFNLY